MQKKDKVFKFVAIGLGAALVVAGILLALRTSGIQEAVDPNSAATANNESFAIDPENLPDGVQITRDGQASEGSGNASTNGSTNASTNASANSSSTNSSSTSASPSAKAAA